jgi:hypothetical protein
MQADQKIKTHPNMGGTEQHDQLPPLHRSIIKFIIDNRKGAEGIHIAAILHGLGTDRTKIKYVAMLSIKIGLQ